MATDYAELAIDGILDDGVLKDIPLVGSLLGVIKFGNSLNMHLTAKKIYKFLFELNSIPTEQRIKKIEEINASKEYQSSVGEMIFELLARIESDRKPEIIGKLFAAVIEEKINYKTYLKCAHIVKNIFYYDLEELKGNYDGETVNGEINDGIFNSGLVDVDFTDTFNTAKFRGAKSSNATLTELGNVVINIGMK